MRITDFGDLAMVLPVAGSVLIWLAGTGRRRAALWWGATVFGCLASTFLLKLAFYTGDLSLSGTALRNPSGHAATSMLVYGTIAWMIGRQVTDWRRPALILLGALAVAAIALSRRLLHAHSLSDVAIGLLVGAGWAAAFLWFGYRNETPRHGKVLPLMVMVAAIALVAHGQHLPIWRAGTLLSLPPAFIARL